MPDVVSPQVVDSLTIDNVKTVAATLAAANANLAQMAAHAAGTSIQNLTSMQNQQNQLGAAAMVQGINKLLNIDVEEAASVNKVMTGNDLAQVIQSLTTVLKGGVYGTATVPQQNASGS